MSNTNKKKRKIHREFVKEYLLNGNKQGKAYMKAYNVDDPIYASKAAYKLLRTPYVKELLEKHRKELDEQYQINRGLIIKDLMELIADCKDEGDRQNLLKSLDMLNKMGSFYTERKEINVSGEGIVFNFVTPEVPEEEVEDIEGEPEPEEIDPDDRSLLPEEEFDEDGNLITDN